MKRSTLQYQALSLAFISILIVNLLAFSAPGFGQTPSLSQAAAGIDSSVDQPHAVVLVYHHVGINTPASTSISPKMFAAHLDYLVEAGFTVWPLQQIVAHLQADKVLPKNTVAITFDDAYESIFHHAHTLLIERGMPYTVFLSTKAIVEGHGGHLTWQQINSLVQAGVELGNHSHQHQHLLASTQDENPQQWHERVKQDLETAQQHILQATGVTPRLFAYPYGEYNYALADVVESLNLVGVGQHSGSINLHSDFTALPRFPMGGAYTDLARLKTALNSQPLPVQKLEPLLLTDKTPVSITLTIAPGAFELANVACYASGQGLMQIQRVPNSRKLKITTPQSLPIGRSKFNCTAPHNSAKGVFFWWSHLIMRLPTDRPWFEG